MRKAKRRDGEMEDTMDLKSIAPKEHVGSTPSPGTTLADRFHLEGELARLVAGDEGCGCALCQEFYKTIDLNVYGDRVKRFDGGHITVRAIPKKYPKIEYIDDEETIKEKPKKAEPKPKAKTKKKKKK